MNCSFAARHQKTNSCFDSRKDGVKRYRIIRLSDFDKPLGIQPKLYTLLVPDKGNYIFAEILDKI